MRQFRFPRSAMFMMVACFLTILGAIGLATEMARNVQATIPGSMNLEAMWWAKLPGLFGTLFLMLAGVGAVGYAVVFLLRLSGLHRLTSLDPRRH